MLLQLAVNGFWETLFFVVALGIVCIGVSLLAKMAMDEHPLNERGYFASGKGWAKTFWWAFCISCFLVLCVIGWSCGFGAGY